MNQSPSVPKELVPLAESVNKMRDLFNLCLRRGLFASIEENAEYLGAYGSLEYEVKKIISTLSAESRAEPPVESVESGENK